VDNGEYNGIKYIGDDDVLEHYHNAQGIDNAFVCVGFMGESDLRNRLYGKLKEAGFNIPSIIDGTAILAADAALGEGVFIGKGAIVNSASTVGNMAIINTGAIVEHDSCVGAFSHVAIGARLSGDVTVGEHCLIGAGATILQGVRVGNDSIIGAGSVVTKDICNNCTALGVPARVIKNG
jgi:UDP-perosamine 4-acetyltransferase